MELFVSSDVFILSRACWIEVREGDEKKMKIIIIAAVTAGIVSVICCNVKMHKEFEIMDKYVKDMFELAKSSIRDAYTRK